MSWLFTLSLSVFLDTGHRLELLYTDTSYLSISFLTEKIEREENVKKKRVIKNKKKLKIKNKKYKEREIYRDRERKGY